MTVNYSDFELKKYLREKAALVNSELNKCLTVKYPPLIYQAMRYSIFAGGKRLRPILVLEGSRICKAEEAKVMPTACALEFIHTYSLIHDDLPAMDDDDLRRGQPTCHKRFGESVAILAGDALLTEAFGLLAKNAQIKTIKAERVLQVVAEVAQAAGVAGMIGGQLVDTCEDSNLKNSKLPSKKKSLEYIHTHKTVALLKVSLKAGAMLSGANSREVKALDNYGDRIGLAFQITDDILDVIGDKVKLGKNGSDLKNNKLTYVSLYGLEKSRLLAKQLVEEAKASLRIFGQNKYVLESLANYIVEREY